jgi:hypothetical protein
LQLISIQRVPYGNSKKVSKRAEGLQIAKLSFFARAIA